MGNSSSTDNDNNNDQSQQEQPEEDYPHPIDDTISTNNNKNDTNLMDDDPFDGSETLGYRVLGVQPNSPASAAGLVSFLDFLVGANGNLLLGSGEELQEGEEYNDVDLPAFLMEHKNESVEFLVWNIKSQQERLVYLTPSDTWGGAGLLGVTIRLDDYAMAEERIIRVLSVDLPHSPAAVAGLVPERDYILGTTQVSLDQTDTLAALLRQYQDSVLELYVYNADSDLVRTVALMPTLSWGGRGLLGADVGMGYLHRLPSAVRTTHGASVERKVRYVNTNSTNSTTSKNTKSTMIMAPEAPVLTGGSAASVASSTTTNEAGSDGGSQQQQGMFEHEPQLEMEPPDHDDDEEEDAPPQVSPVASEAASNKSATTAAAATTASTSSLPVQEALTPPLVAKAAAASAAAAVFSQSPAASKNIIGTAPKSPQPLMPLVPAPPKMSTSSSSSPKPNTALAASSAGGAALLPPPPVLNYDSPPSVKA